MIHSINNTKGILWMTLASLTLSLMSFVVNKVNFHIPTIQILFLSSLVTFGIVVIYLLLREQKLPVAEYQHLYIVRALFSTISMAMWFRVLQILPVTETMAISYITPLLNMVAALLILKEKAKSHHLLAVLVGFAGAMLIIHPIFQGEREGYVLALFTVIIWVVGDVLMKIQSRSARVITQCFYTNLFALLFMLPFAYYYWQTPTTIEIAWVIVIGLIQALNLVAIFKAYSLADMVVIVPLDFTRLLFTMILAYLIYAETINRTSMLGALIILFSTYYLAARERYKVSTV